jgi:transcriptional regulator with XRE-family HTH domain
MTTPPTISELGALLKTRRKERGLSLRDLADETGVSLNTLSRVERGHVPDLANFQRIIDWLDVPPDAFMDPGGMEVSTPETIARHLRADPRLSEEGAARLADLVQKMYGELLAHEQTLAIHLRAAKTFTPAANALLAEVLADMQSNLRRPIRK